MAGEKHLYLTFEGAYNVSALTAETWLTGVRLWADLSVPDLFGTLPSTSGFSADVDTGSNADGTVTSNWNWTSGVNSVVNPIEYLKGISTAAKTFFLTTPFCSKSVLKKIHLYPIEAPAGHAFEGRSAVYTYTTPVAGGTSGNMLPPDQSWVVSLRTNVPGKRGRGRMYMPGIAAFNQTADGRANTSQAGVLATAAAALMAALSVNTVDPVGTHVKPIVTGGDYTKYGVISSCRVGDVFDTQRRRRRQLTEAYSSATITYP